MAKASIIYIDTNSRAPIKEVGLDYFISNIAAHVSGWSVVSISSIRFRCTREYVISILQQLTQAKLLEYFQITSTTELKFEIETTP